MRDVRRAPAELDDVDVVAGRLEQVLERARAEPLVDDVREAAVAGWQAEIEKSDAVIDLLQLLRRLRLDVVEERVAVRVDADP